MRALEPHLRIVPPCADLEAAARTALPDDLGLTAMILVVALLPILLDVAGLAHFGASTLGLSTLGVLWSARALGVSLPGRRRARAGRSPFTASARG